MKKKVLKEVLSKLIDASDEYRDEVLKQLIRNMGQKELEEWIRNSDMSDEMKKKMLADIKSLIESGAVLWDSDDVSYLISSLMIQFEFGKRCFVLTKLNLI